MMEKFWKNLDTRRVENGVQRIMPEFRSRYRVITKVRLENTNGLFCYTQVTMTWFVTIVTNVSGADLKRSRNVGVCIVGCP